YPTANVVPSSPKKLVPKNGVYFVGVRVDDRLRAGMANIGSRPTFTSNGARSIEANILDYDGDLYGKSIEVHFVKRLRDEQKFTNPQELIDQMRRDQQQSVKLQEEFVTLFR
ncbi:MAG TPA: riboflavin kinase, partial [Bacteroidota bacterium]